MPVIVAVLVAAALVAFGTSVVVTLARGRPAPAAAAQPPAPEPAVAAGELAARALPRHPPLHSVVPTPAQPRPAHATAPPPAVPHGGVLAIGDSVMLDAAPNLEALIPGIDVNAAVSRDPSAGIAIMQSLRAAGDLPANIVFALATNGTFGPAMVARVLAVAGGRHVVMLTGHCPYCSWIASNNAAIDAGCTAARNCSVADWNALADAHPGWFGSDGVHMGIGGPGGQAYAELVRQYL